MVECQLPKLDVAGSIPVARSNLLSKIAESILRSVDKADLSHRMSHKGIVNLTPEETELATRTG